MKTVSFFFLLLYGCCLTITIEALSPPCLAQLTKQEQLRQQQLAKQRAAEQERQQQLAKQRAAEQERLRQQMLLAQQRAAEQERQQQQLAKQRAAEQERQQQLAKERAAQQLLKPLNTKAPQVDATKASFQQNNTPQLRAYTKSDALFNLKLWLRMDYCQSTKALNYYMLQNAHMLNADPRAESLKLVAEILQRVVSKSSEDSVKYQIDHEVKQYESKSISEIDARTQKIQDKLGTTDLIKAYNSSICSKR